MDYVFEWHDEKDRQNQQCHGVSFYEAKGVFTDEQRIIIKDEQHSASEERFFCIGKVDNKVITVRFTYRDGVIRIFGAGYWRKGRKQYEERV